MAVRVAGETGTAAELVVGVVKWDFAVRPNMAAAAAEECARAAWMPLRSERMLAMSVCVAGAWLAARAWRRERASWARVPRCVVLTMTVENWRLMMP